MFTGIIETMGEIAEVQSVGGNRVLDVRSDIAGQLRVDESVSHDGVCLTVVDLRQDGYRVDVIQETLQRSHLGEYKAGDRINLERAMRMNDRLDGHIVQGHIDAVGRCTDVAERDGSWVFRFDYPVEHAQLVIPKGSIAVNGISLTISKAEDRAFEVSIIPHTYRKTNLQYVQAGGAVNLEFDMIGKYVQRWMSLRSD